MSNVLTLIGNPDGPALTADDESRTTRALAAMGATKLAADWLAAGHALDLAFESAEPEPAAAAVRAAFAGLAVDIVAQPAAGRRKRLLVADMDSTIIDVESIDEIAAFVGRRAEVARITELAMRGKLEFAAALKRRAQMLAGLEVGRLEEAYRERVHLTPGASALVRTMRADGAFTALVSGGFAFFTARVAAEVGFDHFEANELDIVDGRLTGRVKEPIRGRDAKHDALESLATARQLEPSQTLAVGDGANDIDMLKAAGLGVAYHAKAEVARAAAARIDHADLTALLYLQGYREEDLIA